MPVPKKQTYIDNHMLVLSKQYDMLGLYLKAETEAMIAQEAVKVMQLRRRVLTQYQEIGNQLKVMMIDLG